MEKSFVLQASTPTRKGELTLPHGVVSTPCFMPIATRGAVRLASMETLRALNVPLLLSNTYHLVLRPGIERIQRAGGLHAFLGWDRPMLTDSGGFQVFSLRTHRTLSDNGVWFRSPLDGQEVVLTPESVIRAQSIFGSDISMVLDDVQALPATDEELLRASRRTTAWAARAKEAFETYPQKETARRLLFGIVQGGTNRELRRSSAQDLLRIGFDGYAIGGLSVGESHEEMLAMLDVVMPLLPTSAPRYLMGVGEPEDIVEAVRRGVDLFDCVLPTRNARHALLYSNLREDVLYRLLRAPLSERVDPSTLYTRVHITNERFADDFSLLHPEHPLLTGVSYAYLRHLFFVDPPAAHLLATIYNLSFYLDLMNTIRRVQG